MPETAISAHTLGFEWPTAWGSSGAAYFWASKDFTSVDGRRYLAGRAGDPSQMLRRAAITVVGGAATVADVSLPKTTNPQDGENVKITGQIFNERGSKVADFFQGRINHALLDATNWPAVFTDNAARRRPLGDSYPTITHVISLIQDIVLALGSAVEYGRLRLSVAPADSADPVAAGANDPRLPVARGTETLVAGTATIAEPRVTSTSIVKLTPQDDDTLGTVRVSSRTAGAGFTIKSSDGGDRGVIGWEVSEPC